MLVELTLSLPRESLSVPVARRVCLSALQVLGVSQSDVDDLGVVITEACTNVLQHVQDGDEYKLHVRVDEQRAVIEVIDDGPGFAGDSLGRRPADAGAESGRGLMLMRSLVDGMNFQVTPDAAVVRMDKHLRYKEDAPVLRR